ncbi:hypothetical protein EB796_006409 [Bugula neritina]|uniref:Uncharacterized protein n=1 Tax=Bugula neritina TaxID=10212 RepID=A0A7J7K9G0_BUGNE|nr:hypothetical protein EB796_006409 [Bugula neritina]
MLGFKQIRTRGNLMFQSLLDLLSRLEEGQGQNLAADLPEIGDEYDDVGTAVRLPPLRESPLVQQNFPERFDEETSVINSIANGDTSSEIISRFISVIGEESLPPVTESNRLQ